MPHTCFSYPSDVPPGTGSRNAVQPAPPGQRSMVYSACFNYPADLRRMPISSCFSYQPDLPRSMPIGSCFRY
jgi:hypothetical protein